MLNARDRAKQAIGCEAIFMRGVLRVMSCEKKRGGCHACKKSTGQTWIINQADCSLRGFSAGTDGGDKCLVLGLGSAGLSASSFGKSSSAPQWRQLTDEQTENAEETGKYV